MTGPIASLPMHIEGGALVVGEQDTRLGVVTDVDFALQELFRGKRVFVSIYGGLTERVAKTVQLALTRSKENPTG